MAWTIVAVVAVVLLAIYLAQWVLKPVVQSFSNQPATTYQWTFADPSRKSAGGKMETTRFPSLYEEPSKLVSLIAPAYNEEDRIEQFFSETLTYLEKKNSGDHTFTWELIIVNDGSKDRTPELVLEKCKAYGVDRVRLLTLDQNQGKGGAVQQGMLHARGEYLLMLDSDAATDIKDLDKLMEAMNSTIDEKGHGIVIGSRAHMQEKEAAEREWYRKIVSSVFHVMVSIFAVRGIKDTQCGFKLFTRETARWLFYNQHLRRWCFDAELLHMAQRQGFNMKEVGVNWQEIAGSKLSVLDASLQMARDLIAIRLAFTLGIWSVNDPYNEYNRHIQNM